MLRTRVIPTLLLHQESLVKTIRFGQPRYIGDPCNTCRIFNEHEVDELIFLDISATVESRAPNLKLLCDISNECFMPLVYGGGIRSIEEAISILKIGFEKIAVNSYFQENPVFVSELANACGSQSIVASIDVKKGFWGQKTVYIDRGRRNTGKDPIVYAREMELLGAGEILLTSIDREGTWEGFDLELVKSVANAVKIPVIAHGGAGSMDHVVDVVKEGHASAVALGSMVTFQKKDMGVLVNFPDRLTLENALDYSILPGTVLGETLLS